MENRPCQATCEQISRVRNWGRGEERIGEEGKGEGRGFG